MIIILCLIIFVLLLFFICAIILSSECDRNIKEYYSNIDDNDL